MSAALPQRRVLHTARLVYCLAGIGALALWHDAGGPVFALSFHHLDLGERSALRLDALFTWGLAGAGLGLLTPWAHRLWLPIAVLSAVASAAHWYRATLFPNLVPLAHAARWLGPIGVWLLVRSVASRRDDLRTAAEWTLRAAAAATFVGHGIEALEHHPAFVDYLHSAALRLSGAHLTDLAAGRVLTGIGIVDLAVAAALLTCRQPAVAAWMAFWGALTACARIVHHGLDGWPEAAIRAANGGLPLLLLLWWTAPRPTAARVPSAPRP